MYQATVTYPYGNGKRIRTTHVAFTKLGARIKAWWAIRYGNSDFFEISVDAI